MSTDSQATYLWRCFNDLELHIRSLGAGAPEPVPTTCNSEPISKETGWTNEAEWTRGAGWRKAVGSHQPLRLQCLAGIDVGRCGQINTQKAKEGYDGEHRSEGRWFDPSPFQPTCRSILTRYWDICNGAGAVSSMYECVWMVAPTSLAGKLCIAASTIMNGWMCV